MPVLINYSVKILSKLQIQHTHTAQLQLHRQKNSLTLEKITLEESATKLLTVCLNNEAVSNIVSLLLL